MGLSEFIEELLVKLGAQKPFLAEICETGGALQLYIACFFDKNSGETFDWKVLAKCAELQISLAFDAYPYLPKE